MSVEEVKAMEVTNDATVEKKKKKSKKSKTVEPEVVDEVTSLKRKAQEEHEDAPKKKKSKKNKEAKAEEEAAPMEVEEPAAAEEGEKKKKKKSKKNKDAEAVEEKATEEVAEEEGEKKTKKKKSKVTEPAPEESPEEEESAAKEEKAEEAEVEEKAEETAAAGTPENLTVFVGGLPWSAEEATVKKDFEECGEISSFRFLTDRETGRPKGSCFIDYVTGEGVKKALEFNETDYGGRTIFVRMANDESHKGKGKKGKGKKGEGKKGELRQPGEKPEGCKSVVVKNFTYSTTEDALWKLFEDCGAIERLKLLTDRETGESKGIAFVDFAEDAGVDAAIKKCNTEVEGRMIFIDYSGGKGDGKGKGEGKKGKGKKGDGKKGKGKGKKGGKDSAIRSANSGAIAEFAGEKKTFDSDSE